MSTITRYLSAALAVAIVAQARAEDRAPNREESASIQEATKDLIREVENLQDLLEEQSGEKVLAVYRQADAMLAGVEAFQKSTKSDASRERLYKAFDEQDRKLHDLLKAVRDLGPEQRLALKRAVARVRAADNQLHYMLSVWDTSEGMTKQVLERQTLSLLDAAQQLDKTGGHSLGTVQGHGVLIGDFHKLAEEVEQFQKGLNAGNDRAQLRKDFAVVNRAWGRAIEGMRDLKAGDHMRLLRAAGQFDRIFERLHRLLIIEGERPKLIIRT